MNETPTMRSSQPPAFGTTPTAHLLSQRWVDGHWQAARIQPFEDLRLSPFAQSLHYGQSVFEGMQAYLQPDGTIALFRPKDHLLRLNISARRMCLPEVDPERLLEDVRSLIAQERDACPDPPGCLYVRPLLFADEPSLAPKTPSSARLLVMLSPAHGYFQKAAGLRLVTATDSARAAPGGTGSVKCAGNYAGVLRQTAEVKAQGFDEVLWLDPCEHHYLQETGTTNVFVVRDKTVTTPSLTDSILAGITRDTLLHLAQSFGLATDETRIPVDRSDWEGVTEVFTSGTASSVMHVSEVVHRGETIFQRPRSGPVTTELAAALAAMRFGTVEDGHGWRFPCHPQQGPSTGRPSTGRPSTRRPSAPTR